MASQWYYKTESEQVKTGPISDRELKQLAVDARIGPNDYVWREGLRDWVYASKVKGLFGSTSLSAEPEVDHGTGPVILTPRKKAAPPRQSKVPASPASAPKPPAAQSPSIPKTPSPVSSVAPVTPADPFGLPPLENDADPFGFGAPPTTNDPFGLGDNAAFPANDPFSNDFANLSALAQSAPAIQKAPENVDWGTPASSAPAIRTRDSADVNSEEWQKHLLWFGIPFLATIPLAFMIGCVNAFMPLIILCILITGGTGKGLGVMTGTCLRKLDLRNEIAILGFGAFIGCVAVYFFWAAYFWAQCNVISGFNNMVMNTVMQHDDGGETEMPVNDEEIIEEEQPAENQDLFASAERIEQPGAADMEDDEEAIENDGNMPAGNEEFVETDFEPDHEFKDFIALGEMWQKLTMNGVSIFEAVWPPSLFKYVWFRYTLEKIASTPFNRYKLYFVWFLEICFLVGGTAHATWLVTQGHEPD